MSPVFLITLAAFGGIVLVAAFSSKLAGWLNLPVLLLFLGVGMLARSLPGNSPLILTSGFANILGTVAMAFILFSGGFDSRWRSILPVLGRGLYLSSVGVLLTALFTGLFVWSLKRNDSFADCFLVGAIVSSTDAAAVFSILRGSGVSIKSRLKNLLELESGSNDPMAAFLTIFLVGMLRAPAASGYWEVLPSFCLAMGVGTAVGALLAAAAIWVVNRIDYDYDGLYYVTGIGTVLLIYAAAEAFGGNGFMAVYVAGLVMGNSRFIYKNSFGRFHDAMAWLMQVLLFTVLGALVTPKQLLETWHIALPIALFLMFVSRPAAVHLCLLGRSYTWRERLFVSWVGLRGGAPIMLATIPLVAFGDSRPEMQGIFTTVFTIVVLSVILQGKTLMPLARRLHLDLPLKPKVRIPLEFDYTGQLQADEMREFVLPEVEGGQEAGARTICSLNLPKGALVLLVRRGADFVVPHGDTELLPGDSLMVMGNDEALRLTAARLGAEPDWDRPGDNGAGRKLRALWRRFRLRVRHVASSSAGEANNRPEGQGREEP